jgi:colanic acid/amylovoran biosynthesis glycosyltransferase
MRGPRVLYVCHTFPWVTQSFTVREVALLRAHSLDVGVLAFRRPTELLDAQAEALLELTHYVPRLSSGRFLAAVLRSALRRPAVFMRLVAFGLSARHERRSSLGLRLRGVLDVLRGAYAGEAFPDTAHFHAEFADNACTAALAAAELLGRTFSFKSHSSFNPQGLDQKAERAAFIALENEFDGDFFFADVRPRSKLFLNRGGAPIANDESQRVSEGDVLRILCVGTLQEKKGQLYLVEAIRLLVERGVDCRCTLIGSGPLEEAIRSAVRAASLEDVITIEPYLPHADLVALYAQHDVFALPCVVAVNGDRDGLPNVLIEAAAAGCVLVSSAVSGISELIENDRSGLLVPERDAHTLADVLELVADDRNLRRRLRAGAFQVIRERFDLGRNVADLAERFSEVSGRR